MIKLKILVGCEESQAVCIELRKLGHEAFSCDLLDCSGGHPEWHLKMDIFDAVELIKPDALFAFPPRAGFSIDLLIFARRAKIVL